MSYQNLLLSGMFLLGSVSGLSAQEKQKPDCRSLRHSTLVATDEEEKGHYVVIRGRRHLEYFGDKKHYIKSTLKWTSSCSFKATMVKCTVPDFPLKPGAVMYVTFESYKRGVWHGRVQIGDESVPIRYKNIEKAKR